VWPPSGALVPWMGRAIHRHRAHLGGSPGGERCVRGRVFVESARAYHPALAVAASGPLQWFRVSPHDVVLTGARNMGHAHSPDLSSGLWGSDRRHEHVEVNMESPMRGALPTH
jgi:hypothetical protein